MMQGDVTFTVYNLTITSVLVIMLICESIAGGSNIMINYALGLKSFNQFRRIMTIGFLLISSYKLFWIVIIIAVGDQLIILLIEVLEVQAVVLNIKVYYIFTLIVFAYHPFIAEAISALGFPIFPTYSALIGRLGINVGLAILFIKTNVGDGSILLSCIISQCIILTTNSVYLISKIRMCLKAKPALS